MGVNRGFWDVLKPVARLESLHSLRGKWLAIDLSFWMIQLLSRVKGIHLRKPHIRLLFFRTIHLVAKIGAFPVFVADGDPPALKLEVRLSRFSRISGVPLDSFVGEPNCNSLQNRNIFFTDSIDECVKLLELLGIPVLRAKHEAEGLCAELQKQGLVSACVTPDSDAFLYGAEHVIKIFQADVKDPHVESYMMKDIETFLGLHREHLVALALLAGCDYNVSGVPGIGCQNAVRLIKVVPKDQIFDRLQDWGAGRFASEPENGSLVADFTGIGGRSLQSIESTGLKERHCSTCGHPGTKKSHVKLGCEKCWLEDASDKFVDQQGCRPKVRGFKCTCECCTQRETMRKNSRQEGWKLKVCQKISATHGFPNKDIIEIFMNPEHDSLSGDRRPSLACKPPHLEALEEFLEVHLHWDKAYVRQKLLPLLSFYCLRDTAAMRSLPTSSVIHTPSINGIYVPHSIQRIKILFSKPLYRLRWTRSTSTSIQEDWLGLQKLPSSCDTKVDDNLDIMVSDLQTESLDNSLLFTTDEDMTLVKEAYPDLVLQFEREQELRRSKKKGTTRKKKDADDLSGKQLRITSFFQARKEPCSHNAKGKPESILQRSSLDKKTQLILAKGSEMPKRREAQLEEAASSQDQRTQVMAAKGSEMPKRREPQVEEAVITIERQGGDSCEVTRTTEIDIIHVDDVSQDSIEGKYQYQSDCTKVVLKADVKSNNSIQNSGNKMEGLAVAVIEDLEDDIEPEPQPVILIEDSDIIESYSCKARRLRHNNASPGSHGSRVKFSSCLKQTVQEAIDLETTPRLPSWREFYASDSTKSSEVSKTRVCQVSARRVLFS